MPNAIWNRPAERMVVDRVVLVRATGHRHRHQRHQTGAQHPADDEPPGVAPAAARQDGDERDHPERLDRGDQGKADGGEHGSAWQRGRARVREGATDGHSRAT